MSDQVVEIVNDTKKKVWSILESVVDPEIPVLTIGDLGILRKLEVEPDKADQAQEKIIVTITPTYSGCPAMDMIATNIRMALLENGYVNHEIKSQLSPAWSTDWMTEDGKQKLKKYGIAPPVGKVIDQQMLEEAVVDCPHCGSSNTQVISEFSSTACKALYKCNDCLEPFDYFKCH